MTFNWDSKGPCSLEARVIVKMEMRTQLAGIKATPAYKWSDSPWGLQRVTLMFLLTIDVNLVFLPFYLRNCDWLSTPPSCVPQHHSCLVGWFGFIEIVTLLKCAIQWLLIYSQLCNHHHCLFSEFSAPPERNPMPHLCSSPPSTPLPTCEPWAVTCLLLWMCLFCTCDINVFMPHVNFRVWLLWLSVMFSGKDEGRRRRPRQRMS